MDGLASSVTTRSCSWTTVFTSSLYPGFLQLHENYITRLQQQTLTSDFHSLPHGGCPHLATSHHDSKETHSHAFPLLLPLPEQSWCFPCVVPGGMVSCLLLGIVCNKLLFQRHVSVFLPHLIKSYPGDILQHGSPCFPSAPVALSSIHRQYRPTLFGFQL